MSTKLTKAEKKGVGQRDASKNKDRGAGTPSKKEKPSLIKPKPSSSSKTAHFGALDTARSGQDADEHSTMI